MVFDCWTFSQKVLLSKTSNTPADDHTTSLALNWASGGVENIVEEVGNLTSVIGAIQEVGEVS